MITPTPTGRLLHAQRLALEAVAEIVQAGLQDGENASAAFAKAQLENAAKCLREAVETEERR